MRTRATIFWLMTCGLVACGGNAIDMGGAEDAGAEADANSKGGASGAGGTDASAPEVSSQGGAPGQGGAAPSGYKFDVFNTQLNGAFAAYESQRRQPILQKLSQLDSDVLCVTEMWSDADKQALAGAAKVYSFPYSYVPVTTWSTPISDPTDQNGTVPEQPSTPACSESLDKMNAALDCLRDSCLSMNEDGKPDDAFKNCIMSCASTGLLPLITGTDADRRCWSCIFTQMDSYETVAWTRDQCANNVDARLVFRGASNVMVLSRHPIASEPEMFVLPATEFQQTVIRVPLQMSNGASVDFYCGSATTPVTSCITRPYTGVYGGDGALLDCTKQWEAEQLLQAGKINTWVKAKSARAIVAGDYYAGPGYKGEYEIETLKEMAPEAYAKLTLQFALAAPLGSKPQCTYCPADNPLITPPGTGVPGANTWTSLILIGNIGVPEVTGATTILRDAVLDLGLKDPKDNSYKVPLSMYYGFRSIIDLKP